MKIGTLVEMLSGFHLSHYVHSQFPERGGAILVGPPGHLKTAMLETLSNYPNAFVVSDLTVRQAADYREDMIGGKLITLGFADVAKLYARASHTSANIEGFLQAITSEGFRATNWEDNRLMVVPARCLVLGCMTLSFYTQNATRWIKQGLARRFLWLNIRLSRPDIVLNSIMANQRLEFGRNGFSNKIPAGSMIPLDLETREKNTIRHMIRYQPGPELGYILLSKAYSALKWKFPKEKGVAEAILKDFAPALSREGSELEI